MNKYYMIFPIFVKLSKCEELEDFLESFLVDQLSERAKFFEWLSQNSIFRELIQFEILNMSRLWLFGSYKKNPPIKCVSELKAQVGASISINSLSQPLPKYSSFKNLFLLLSYYSCTGLADCWNSVFMSTSFKPRQTPKISQTS